MGLTAQPHGTVSDTSFYKHIDSDLPDAERIRQLLIWCASRAAVPPKPRMSEPPLPVLSTKAETALRALQEDAVRMLAERRVDLSLFPPTASGSRTPEPQTANAQNVANRGWEVMYASHIKRCAPSPLPPRSVY